MSNELDIKQLKFIDNLFRGMNQGKAYSEAGYISKTPDCDTSKMVRYSKIIEEIEERRKEINRRNTIRLSRVSETALAEILEIVKGGTNHDRVKLEAVKDVLNRVGLKPVEKYQHSGELTYKLIDVDMSKYPKNE